MADNEHRNDYCPSPPPLPGAIDSDDLATLPATSPWQLPSGAGGDGRSSRAPEKEADEPSSPPAEEPSSAPDASEDIDPATKDCRPQHSRALLGLMTAAVALLALIALLLMTRMLSDDKEDDHPTVAVTMETPKILETDTAADAYAAKRRAVRAILAEIAASPDDIPARGVHQSVADLGARLADSTTPFATDVKNALSNAPPEKHTPARFDRYDQVWTLGVTVLDIATKALEEMTALGVAAGDDAAPQEAAVMKAWLIEWLLGQRGLYCELRNLYWRQARTGEPPLGPDRKAEIAKLRKERREFAKAFDYPTTPLYEYCDDLR